MNLLLRCILLAVTAVLSIYAGTGETVTITGRQSSISGKAQVFLPSSYTASEASFPTCYLLHGYGGDHRSWSRIVALDSLADRYGCILVCPDAGYNSWYIDSPLRPEVRYETYCSADVVEFIDARYRTRKESRYRAIIGSSMGGHGALRIAVKYPDRFRGAGSISGIINLTQFRSRWELPRVLGPYDESSWKSYSFIGMLHLIKPQQTVIVLDCGTGDAIALDGNRKAHSLLLEKGIPHDYWERPGDHSASYPAKVLEYHLLYFSRLFRQK
jgi:S-formylglutathione hydrolase FrmB